MCFREREIMCVRERLCECLTALRERERERERIVGVCVKEKEILSVCLRERMFMLNKEKRKRMT